MFLEKVIKAGLGLKEKKNKERIYRGAKIAEVARQICAYPKAFESSGSVGTSVCMYVRSTPYVLYSTPYIRYSVP